MARTTASATSCRRHGADTRWEPGPGVVEHARVAHEAGEDRADADAARAQVLAQALREPTQAELRRAVDRGPRGADLAGERGHEDQVTAAARDHRLRQRARQHHRGAQVHRQRAIDLLDAERRQQARTGQPRVGDERVDVGALVRQALDRLRVGEVDGQRARARLGGEWLEDLGAPPGEHELGAGRAQAPRDGMAQTARRAGEQDGPPGEVHGGKTATVAVNPCRNGSPPTGPISPAAKKPAAGAPASSSSSVRAS